MRLGKSDYPGDLPALRIKMTRSKIFWYFWMTCAAALYLLGLLLWVFSRWQAAGAALFFGILLLHVAELKTALKIGRTHGLSDRRILFMDLLFGFTWWLPVRNDIFDS
jgi:hypothetical protein